MNKKIVLIAVCVASIIYYVATTDTGSSPTQNNAMPSQLNKADYVGFCFKVDQLTFDTKCVGKEIKLDLKNAKLGVHVGGELGLFFYHNNQREIFAVTPPTDSMLAESSNFAWMTVSGIITRREQGDGMNLISIAAHQISEFTATEANIALALEIDKLERKRREKHISEQNFPSKTKNTPNNSTPAFECANQTVTMRDFAAGNFINYYASKAMPITSSSSSLRRQALNACLQCVRKSFEDLRSEKLFVQANTTYDLGNKACLAVQDELDLKYKNTYP